MVVSVKLVVVVNVEVSREERYVREIKCDKNGKTKEIKLRFREFLAAVKFEYCLVVVEVKVELENLERRCIYD